jgi:hypothetical protein
MNIEQKLIGIVWNHFITKRQPFGYFEGQCFLKFKEEEEGEGEEKEKTRFCAIGVLCERYGIPIASGDTMIKLETVTKCILEKEECTRIDPFLLANLQFTHDRCATEGSKEEYKKKLQRLKRVYKEKKRGISSL